MKQHTEHENLVNSYSISIIAHLATLVKHNVFCCCQHLSTLFSRKQGHKALLVWLLLLFSIVVKIAKYVHNTSLPFRFQNILVFLDIVPLLQSRNRVLTDFLLLLHQFC